MRAPSRARPRRSTSPPGRRRSTRCAARPGPLRAAQAQSARPARWWGSSARLSTAARTPAASGMLGAAAPARAPTRWPRSSSIAIPSSTSTAPRSGRTPRPLGPDRDQARALLRAADQASPRDRALAYLLAHLGLRVSEALRLQVADVATTRGHRTVWVTRKRGRRQQLALSPAGAQALDALLNHRPEGPCSSQVPAVPWIATTPRRSSPAWGAALASRTR